MNAIVDFFSRNDKLIPPMITGLVTVSIYIFTINRDRLKEKRKTRKDQRQKMLYLINLLEDVVTHCTEQMKDDQIFINDVATDPSKSTLLSYLPPNYLERLSKVLANDAYFAAYNGYYHHLNTTERVRIYNDFTIDIDVFQGMMIELRRCLSKATGHYEQFHNNYLQACSTLIKKINDLRFELSTNRTDDMDKDDFESKLYKYDTNELYKLIAANKLSMANSLIDKMQDDFHNLLRPDFSMFGTAEDVFDSCKDAGKEYRSLVNTNMGLSNEILSMNKAMQERLNNFSSRLETLKKTKV